MSSTPSTAVANTLRSSPGVNLNSNESGLPSTAPRNLMTPTRSSGSGSVNPNILPGIWSPKFLGLPAEIRNMIYRQLIVVSSSENRICVGTRYRCALPTDLATCKELDFDAEDPYPDRGYLAHEGQYPRYFFALWSVNKQVASEARNVFYSENLFSIGYPEGFNKVAFLGDPSDLERVKDFTDSVPKNDLALIKDLAIFAEVNSDYYDIDSNYLHPTDGEDREPFDELSRLLLTSSLKPQRIMLDLVHTPDSEASEIKKYQNNKGKNTSSPHLVRGIQYLMAMESLQLLQIDQDEISNDIGAWIEIWLINPRARKIVRVDFHVEADSKLEEEGMPYIRAKMSLSMALAFMLPHKAKHLIDTYGKESLQGMKNEWTFFAETYTKEIEEGKEQVNSVKGN